MILPVEVLIHVIEFIDHPKDLFSLASTARALYAIIVPQHIDYRHISCEISSKYVWGHLLDTPYDTWSSIRYLDVSKFHGRTQIPRKCKISGSPPPSWSRDDVLKESDTFIRVLSRMINLKVFKFVVGNNNKEFNVISEAIGKANCDLEELGVFFECRDVALEERFKEDKILRDPRRLSLFCDYLPSLRKYTISITRRSLRCDNRAAFQMLLNAPNLTHMTIAFEPPVHSFQGTGQIFNISNFITISAILRR